MKNTDSDHLVVGHVTKPHGLKGEFHVRLFARRADWLMELKEFQLSSTVLTQDQTQWKNYTVRSARSWKTGLIVKAQELDSRNQAELARGAAFRIAKGYLCDDSPDRFYLFRLLGFRVSDIGDGKKGGGQECGRIVRFSSNGAQDLAVVQKDSRFFEVPLVDAYIERIDWKLGEVVMNLPQGLIQE